MAKGDWGLKARARLEGNPEEEGGVLFDTRSATLCTCNGTAWVLLKALAHGTGQAELVATLTRRYDVDEETAREHVLAFLRELSSMDLVDGRD